MAEPRIAIDILVNCQSATSQLKKFNKELNNTVQGGKRVSNWLSRGFGRLIGAYFGIQTARNIFNTGKQMQLLEQSIIGLTKSTQDWAYIQDIAFKTGTRIQTVAKGYRNFFAAAKMAGFEKSDIQNMYSGVLVASRAIGASQEQTSGALLALEQMISKGTVSMEELRRQLGNALPGAFEIGAKAMNMTTKEFNEFVKTGKLASTEFVPKFIKALVEEYGGGFKQITETLDYATQNLANAWTMLATEIMKGDVGKELAKAINELTRLITSPAFKQFISLLGQIFRYLIQIIEFALNHLPMVITLLGVYLYASIMSNAKALTFLNMNFLVAIAQSLRFGKAATVAFMTSNAAATIFLRTLSLIIFPLMLIQDLIVGIMHALGKTDMKSVVGTSVDNAKFKAKFGKGTSWNELNVPDFIRNDPRLFKEFKRASERGDTQFMKDMIQQKGMPMYMSPATSSPSAYINKNDNIASNVTIGDINITAQSNSNPQEIGEAVQNALANLFISKNPYAEA